MNFTDNRRPSLKVKWTAPTNVAEPEHYTDDFTADKGYFTEENGTHDWRIENGVMSTVAGDDGTLTYLHIYEHNVTMKLRFRYLDAAPGAQVQLLLRYSCPESYVKLKYIAGEQLWGIYSSEGMDYPVVKYTQTDNRGINQGDWHEVTFTVDGDKAYAYLDGTLLLEADTIEKLSPGRIAIVAKNCRLEVADFDAAFLSGQGVLWKDVVHNKLPDEKYREGGSVFEMTDGSLIYAHSSGDTFVSRDNGFTWDRREQWTNTYHYPNILRLANGDFLKIATKTDDDGTRYKIAHLSGDDGATWREGGIICPVRHVGKFGETTGGALNMNDKVTQTSSGRIFYGQNFDSQGSKQKMYGKYWVLCEIFYSDDNGGTWHKSETPTYAMEGNENEEYFGECKVLECSDGTLRMYNSWNCYGCIVYSESTDGGVTWGPIIKMPELVCARSSMQFFRDTYADNDTTYYMLWVYSKPAGKKDPMNRSRLSLAKSTDGKNWDFLGDVWRWESTYTLAAATAHVVDAFVKTTKDHVICGAGISERLEVEGAGDNHYHHAQRQHIYSLRKDSLVACELKPV